MFYLSVPFLRSYEPGVWKPAKIDTNDIIVSVARNKIKTYGKTLCDRVGGGTEMLHKPLQLKYKP